MTRSLKENIVFKLFFLFFNCGAPQIIRLWCILYSLFLQGYLWFSSQTQSFPLVSQKWLGGLICLSQSHPILRRLCMVFPFDLFCPNLKRLAEAVKLLWVLFSMSKSVISKSLKIFAWSPFTTSNHHRETHYWLTRRHYYNSLLEINLMMYSSEIILSIIVLKLLS